MNFLGFDTGTFDIMKTAAGVLDGITPEAKAAIRALCDFAVAAPAIGPSSPAAGKAAHLFTAAAAAHRVPVELLAALVSVFPVALVGTTPAEAVAGVRARIDADAAALRSAYLAGGQWANAAAERVEQLRDASADGGVLLGEVGMRYALFLARGASPDVLGLIGGTFGG